MKKRSRKTEKSKNQKNRKQVKTREIQKTVSRNPKIEKIINRSKKLRNRKIGTFKD